MPSPRCGWESHPGAGIARDFAPSSDLLTVVNAPPSKVAQHVEGATDEHGDGISQHLPWSPQ